MSYEVQKQVLCGHTADVNCLDFSHSGTLVSGSNDKSIRIWSKNADGLFVENRDVPPVSPFVGHKYGVNCVRFSPFGTIIASGSTDGSLIFWSAKDGQQVVKLQHPSGGVIRTCCFSPSSALLATAGDDESVCLWDISTRTLIRSLVGHEAMVTACAFTPDSNFVVSGSTAGDLKLWDACLGHGKALTTHPDAHDLGVCACDFSSQYQSDETETVYTLASCGNDDRVRIWKVKAGDKCLILPQHVLEGHAGNVNCCRFSVDGTLLASAAGDKTVILWDPETGKMINKLEGHSRFVTSCAFSSDNRLLATGSNDKSIIVWMIYQRCTTTNGTSDITNRDTAVTTCISSRSDVADWDMDRVVIWLRELGLDMYEEVFRRQQIDGKSLLHMRHEKLLHALAIKAPDDRLKLIRAVRSLCTSHDPLNESTIAPEFLCPITCEVMRHPVVAADGFSYEKHAILTWIQSGNTSSPMTNQRLSDLRVIENRTLALLISRYVSYVELDSKENPLFVPVSQSACQSSDSCDDHVTS